MRLKCRSGYGDKHYVFRLRNFPELFSNDFGVSILCPLTVFNVCFPFLVLYPLRPPDLSYMPHGFSEHLRALKKKSIVFLSEFPKCLQWPCLNFKPRKKYHHKIYQEVRWEECTTDSVVLSPLTSVEGIWVSSSDRCQGTVCGSDGKVRK